MHNLPLAVTRMIGRDETVAALVSRRLHQRLVTIVGPGGVGKTAVAIAVAERMIASYEHGVWLVGPRAERGCNRARPRNPHRESSSRPSRGPKGPEDTAAARQLRACHHRRGGNDGGGNSHWSAGRQHSRDQQGAARGSW